MAALRAYLLPRGLVLQAGQQRPGEVLLVLAVDDGHATTLTLAISPRHPARPALLRTLRFDIGYQDGDSPAESLPMRQILSLAKQFAALADGPEVARHLLAAMKPPATVAEPQLDPGSESALDAIAVDSGATEMFQPALCSRRPELAPRAAGARTLLVAAPAGSGERPGEVWARFSCDQQPGSAQSAARAMAGRCWARTAQGLQRLTLHPSCGGCAVRTDCAGCWQQGGPAPDAWGQLEAALSQAGWQGPVEAVGPEMTAVMGDPPSSGLPTSSNATPILVISGANLAERTQRLALAVRLRQAPRPETVLVLGRQPAVIAQARDALDGPDLLSQLQPADAALVARSLLGGALQLTQARWPGRDSADPWWLQLQVRPAGLPAARPVEHVTLLLNRRCVTVCRYCDLPLRLREDMPLRQVWSVLEEIAAQGATSLEFFGGEVMLRPDLLTILARAQELGLQTFVTTTGVGLDDTKLKALARARIHDLSISCDAADPAIHDDLKSRQGMHAAALRAAQGLRQHGAPQVGWNSVITPFNLDELPKIVQLAADLGLNGATFFLCQPVAELGNATPLLTREQYLHLLQDVLPHCHEVGRERGVHVGIRPAIDREPTPPSELLQRLSEGTYNRIYATPSPCRVVEHMVSLHAGGDVRLCNQPLMQFEADAVVGNLMEHSLQQVVSSAAAALFRARAGHFEACRFCTFDHASDGADRGLRAQVAGEAAAESTTSSAGPQ